MNYSDIRKNYKLKRKKIKREFKSFKKYNTEEYKTNKSYFKNKYKNELKKLKQAEDRLLDIYFNSDDFRELKNPPRRGILVEIGNCVTHGIGSALSIVALVLMLIKSNTVEEYISAIIYFLGLFIMFTFSCIYHSFRYGSTVKRLFRRFDYSSIYLLIGATFTPILLCYLGGSFGIVFCTVQWALIILGITFIGVFGPSKFKWFHYPLYIILGWSAVIFLPKMMGENKQFFLWILIGGITYTLGIIPFALNKKSSHFFWHIFVLLGAIIHFMGIYLCIYAI